SDLLNRGKRDIYLARVSEQGELLWQKGFGSSENDDGRTLYAMGNNRYLLAAGIGAANGEIENHIQATDTWLAIIDENGELLQQATFGGNKKDSPTAITQLSGGDYVLCGESFSETGITNYHGGGDYWLMRFDSDLNLIWERAYGGSSFDSPWDISAGENNSCVVGGLTQSINGDIMGTFPSLNAWLVSLDPDGEITGSRSFGGGQYDGCHALTRSPSGGIVSAGYTDSFDGDLEKHGSHWAWVMLLNDDALGLFSVNEWSDSSELIISWNDSSKQLEIQPQDSRPYTLMVFNINGQLVQQITSSGSQTEKFDFPKGQYYLITGEYGDQLINPIRFYAH
ncbi:hypothetical protein N8482_02900, partial [Chitinophagales bacterium]|nr:hypothetical protein [Chitinophagales bacterium]